MTCLLRLDQLSYAYPDGRPALQGVSFEINENEHVGLIGPNGAGKTTLLLCICGVLKVKPGMVTAAGLDPTNPAQRRQLPAHVGIVFQNSDDQLFSTTVAEDVAFGPLNLDLPQAEVRQRVAEALGRVGLSGAEERVVFHLSGGAKRRAALAGVLAMRPELLLLDEPSMFLDPRGRRGLVQLLGEIPGAKLIATHDLDLVWETCPRVLVMDEGRVVADGPATELLTDAGLMEQHGLEVPRNRP